MKQGLTLVPATLVLVWSLALAARAEDAAVPAKDDTTGKKSETLAELSSRVSIEAAAAYRASPFAGLSQDYFLRFSRDPQAVPAVNEVLLDAGWSLELSPEPTPLSRKMAEHLGDFLRERMQVELRRRESSGRSDTSVTSDKPDSDAPADPVLVLLESGGGDPAVADSFTISVKPGRITLQGQSPAGLRDAIVRFVDHVGFRRAPIVQVGAEVYRPRLPVRLGSVPWMGSYKDLVFLGYNAAFVGGGNLHALSVSDAIPELAARRIPGMLAGQKQAAAQARDYGLKTYCFVDTRQKFPRNDPLFAAHPELRGALTWKADGEYVLCTEHPLVRRYLSESVEGIFRADPQFDGLVCIIGGEGFYHCFMRPFGVEKGHTNCARCEKLGAETVVANLCNTMAAAARRVNPQAEVIFWPYSAEHVWSADRSQRKLIERLQPGTAIFTEIEKDEYVEKPEGVRKHLWDYSIDLIGPGERAKEQIAACREAGISIYIKSEPELGFEAPRLPHIPAMDRWADRAEALASCGAHGAWVFPAFRPCYGTSAAEINKFFWWDPVPQPEPLLERFAARLAGPDAAPHLRAAWKFVSQAIEWSPELPSYYTGPYYLGPAHPMCVDPQAELPAVFHGYYLFMAEIADAEGLQVRPTFVTKPTGNIAVFGRYYRRMEELLEQAAARMAAAEPLVPERCQTMFRAERSAVDWFYRTARTEANFYESCQLRDRLRSLAEKPQLSGDERFDAAADVKRWRQVLRNELENTAAALPLVEADMRLDFYFGSDHTFPHAADMIRAKLEILAQEIDQTVPALAQRLGIEAPVVP